MNNNPNINSSKWKKVLIWFAIALASVVALDWLFDGRLRKRLPGKRRDRTDNINL